MTEIIAIILLLGFLAFVRDLMDKHTITPRIKRKAWLFELHQKEDRKEND